LSSIAIKPNTSYLIKAIAQHCQAPLRARFIAMGLLPGSVIEICCIAPLGDPIKIKIKQTRLSIRYNDLKLLKIEQIYDKQTH